MGMGAPADEGLGDDGRPPGRRIKNFHDAELAARDWTVWFGWADAEVTASGADGGLDVEAAEVAVQVKAQQSPVGRPAIQQLSGAARNRASLFFTTSTYSEEAVAWADLAQVALFEMELDGTPVPINDAAFAVFRRGVSDEGAWATYRSLALGRSWLEPGDDRSGAVPRDEVLPDGGDGVRIEATFAPDTTVLSTTVQWEGAGFVPADLELEADHLPVTRPFGVVANTLVVGAKPSAVLQRPRSIALIDLRAGSTLFLQDPLVGLTRNHLLTSGFEDDHIWDDAAIDVPPVDEAGDRPCIVVRAPSGTELARTRGGCSLVCAAPHGAYFWRSVDQPAANLVLVDDRDLPDSQALKAIPDVGDEYYQEGEAMWSVAHGCVLAHTASGHLACFDREGTFRWQFRFDDSDAFLAKANDPRGIVAGAATRTFYVWLDPDTGHPRFRTYTDNAGELAGLRLAEPENWPLLPDQMARLVAPLEPVDERSVRWPVPGRDDVIVIDDDVAGHEVEMAFAFDTPLPAVAPPNNRWLVPLPDDDDDARQPDGRLGNAYRQRWGPIRILARTNGTPPDT